MNKGLAEPPRSAPPVPSPRRLAELLSSFTNLRNDGLLLVKQIRGSLSEMRELRNLLKTHRTALYQLEHNGNRNSGTELQNRYGLTRREVQVAKLLAKGRSNTAIAEELEISVHTARHHTQRILSKLEVHSRSAAGAKIRG
jgi:DNA-binding NarL/FixJ family response regulator